MKRILPDDAFIDAHAKHLDGMTVRDVAAELKVGIQTVYKRWDKLGLPRKPTSNGKPRKPSYVKLTDEQVIDAYNDYMANPAIRILDVAQPLGVTIGALCHRWRIMGLETKERNAVRYAREGKPAPPDPMYIWEPVLDTAEVKPRRAGDKWACDVYIQGSRWRTFKHRYRGPALELGRRYVRALVAELTGDGWKANNEVQCNYN